MSAPRTPSSPRFPRGAIAAFSVTLAALLFVPSTVDAHPRHDERRHHGPEIDRHGHGSHKGKSYRKGHRYKGKGHHYKGKSYRFKGKSYRYQRSPRHFGFHERRHGGYGYGPHGLRVPRRLGGREYRLYRPYYHGRSYYRPHRHHHTVYRFPVVVADAIVFRSYPYCEGGLFVDASVFLPPVALGYGLDPGGSSFGFDYYGRRLRFHYRD